MVRNIVFRGTLAALTYPPNPPSSPTLRERKGGIGGPHLPPTPFRSHAVGEEGG